MAKINNVQAYKVLSGWMNSLNEQGEFTKTLEDVRKQVSKDKSKKTHRK